MNYEQKYKEALERASKLRVQNPFDTVSQMMEHVFPELMESEDEKIRKGLIENFKWFCGDFPETTKWGKDDDMPVKDIITWLEKQGEQKPKDRYTFKSIPRLLDMIEPTDRAKSYCQKLIDSLLQEGYTTDANIVSDCLKQMNGEKVAMATMDEPKSDWCEEDERIMKEIVDFINRVYERQALIITDEEKDNWIAWLEKKGNKPRGKSALEAIKEEKGKSKFEPKFHEGDWVVNRNGGLWRIKKVFKNTYDIESLYGGALQSIKSADTDCHLWTIQDAKDGDVLVSQYNNPFMYNGNHDTFHVGSYCGISVEGRFDIATEKCSWTENVNIYPATKEQRDLLFSKMKEDGCEWDAEKKMVKEIEPKFKVGDWVFHNTAEFIYMIQTIGRDGYGVISRDGKKSVVNYSAEINYRLWTIQNAKDGDVLNVNGAPFIYKKHDKDYVYFYCGVNLAGEFVEANGNDIWDINSKVYPATKEQCDLLFSKMKESGYEWDAEKKLIKERMKGE